MTDRAGEARIVARRAYIGLGLVALACIGLGLQQLRLQVIEHDHFKTLANDNRVNVKPLAPTRGLIFDRNGVVLAQNRAAFSLVVTAESVPNLDVTITRLREVLDVSADSEARFRAALRRARPFDAVPLRLRLDDEEVARFSVNRYRFPGVEVQARLVREYPLGAMMAHVVGYVGRINVEEMERIDASDYRGSTHIGKTGIERAYEDLLHGSGGFEHVETNAHGRTLRTLERQQPAAGENLYLTIDAQLQQVAEEALGARNGSVVAIDPRNGELLAFVSQPGFDPNLFVDGISPTRYRALLNSPDRPLFNRALRGQYPPGSTIKPIMALAGLNAGAHVVHNKVRCHGWMSLPGKSHRYRDWKRGGHGSVNVSGAITESCDVFFYHLALDLGINAMHDFMSHFALGTRTGVDLLGETTGLVPNKAWKKRARGEPWYNGETLIAGIGQGFMLTSPLQLAHSTAVIANAGRATRPHLLLKHSKPGDVTMTVHQPEPMPAVTLKDPASWSLVRAAMVDVMHGARGTARRAGSGALFRIAGKTGTAQVVAIAQDEEYDADALDEKLRDHGLFVAFAPADAPRIAVAVIVENGGSGSRAAAPVARRVLDHYLNRRLESVPGRELLLTGVHPAHARSPG